ncbi:MAG: TRAP transporter large permease subunit, partial [Formivibrio sp.]|nr:TRAP transporter large permease subunit [Formivibrio sp.]
QPKSTWKQRGIALVDALWALMLPVIIVGGMRTGLFTPTEAAAVAAVYALFVSLFIYREVKWLQVIHLSVAAARTTSTVMFLCAAALVSSYMVTLGDLPAQVTGFLGPLMGYPRLLMCVVMLLLLGIGTVMDLTPTILVMGPVLMPIMTMAGVDPTYFGVMFILVGTLGLIHPPVCTVLNVVCGVAKISLESATKGIWPFLLIETVFVFLFVMFPEIVTRPMVWFH